MKNIWSTKITSALAIVLAIGFLTSITANAADTMWSMMHGEQNALVVGSITEITEEGYLVQVTHVISCKEDEVKGRMFAVEEVPSEIMVKEISYSISYHERTEPEAGDCVVLSVDQKGDVWEQALLALEVSSDDYETLETAQPENMGCEEYAWQLFIHSDGDTTSFAFEGDNILYVDGEIVFDRAEYLKELSEMENMKEAENALESGSSADMENAAQAEPSEAESAEEDTKDNTGAVSVSIIGGADGPTSIFLAGKLGREFVTAVTVIGILLAAGVVGAVVIAVKKRKKN